MLGREQARPTHPHLDMDSYQQHMPQRSQHNPVPSELLGERNEPPRREVVVNMEILAIVYTNPLSGAEDGDSYGLNDSAF